MINLQLPIGRRLVWYLAAEEYVAHCINRFNDSVLFSWIVPPTVIFGRHQIMEQEVNIPFCQQHNIAMFRRKSGGGCVYADRGNLMLSYITQDTHAETVFRLYLDSLAALLQRLGLPAVRTEHNDIMVGDYKVSGNACYALPNATIVHGTMLYNVDFNALQKAITPSKTKLEKHGVQSVRQRVSNLINLGVLQNDQIRVTSIETLSDFFISNMCCETQTLTDNDLINIDQIEQTYLNPAFINPNISLDDTNNNL